MRALLLTLATCGFAGDVAAADPPVAEQDPTGNRFSIHPCSQSMLLLDGQTGETWMLSAVDAAWKPVPRQSTIRDHISGAFDAVASAGSAPAESALLLPLLQEGQVLLDKYGPDHPKVRAVQKRIETVRQLMDSVPGESSTMSEALFRLLLEEQFLLESRGPDHPTVREIRKRIELTRAFMQDQNEGNPTER